MRNGYSFPLYSDAHSSGRGGQDISLCTQRYQFKPYARGGQSAACVHKWHRQPLCGMGEMGQGAERRQKGVVILRKGTGLICDNFQKGWCPLPYAKGYLQLTQLSMGAWSLRQRSKRQTEWMMATSILACGWIQDLVYLNPAIPKGCWGWDRLLLP